MLSTVCLPEYDGAKLRLAASQSAYDTHRCESAQNNYMSIHKQMHFSDCNKQKRTDERAHERTNESNKILH